MRRDFLRLDHRRVEIAWWGAPPTEAPTLVLLHEGLGCVELWRDVPAQLADATGCGVFAFSRFGYGQSDPKPLPWPLTYMQDEARDVLPRVLEAAGIREAILLGHSDGGTIAAIYAGESRDPRLRALILIAAHFFVEDESVAAIRQISDEYACGGELRGKLARYHRDPDTAFRGWSESWLHPGFRSFNITASLPGITVPILALQGANDAYGTEAQLRVLRDHARAPLETLLIPDARHAPHLEAKQTTVDAVARFVHDILSLRGPQDHSNVGSGVRTLDRDCFGSAGLAMTPLRTSQ
ncbi:MAG TPA: alpha/beta fold hydrolase [Acetobacteraceae bacterium]|nr:alpha/beta fold hydrolase [Acetobacteraceae bacterium]